MRVLHVYSGNLWGGIESMLVAIARAGRQQQRDEHEFALCFDARLAAELRRAAGIVHHIGPVRLRTPWSVLRARRVLSVLLHANRFDAVIYHAAWSYALLGGIRTPRHTRTVFWMHDVASGTHWTERMVRRVGPPARLVSNSDFTGASASALWPGVRATTVYCPVTVSSSPPVNDRAVVRAEIGCGLSATVVIQVGRLESWKGHFELLDALMPLREIPGWEYWIVGGAQRAAEHGYLVRLRAHAERLKLADRVRFLGQRDDVNRLLHAADIFCQPTTSPEPFGVAVVEALAAGLPVLVTVPGGAGEVVDDSCGIRVQRGLRSEMATALHQLLIDSACRRALGAAAPARAHFISDPVAQLDRLRGVIEGLPFARRTA